MTNFNERIAAIIPKDESMHRLIYDKDQNLAISTSDGANCLGFFEPIHYAACDQIAQVIDSYNQALPLLREMQTENERLRQGIKDIAEKYAEMEKLRSQFYTEKEQAETALLFANRENKKLREGIGRALEQGRNAELIECVAELEALQNDA